MTDLLPNSCFEVLLEEIDLPERAYELAERRYTDLAQWISRPDSSLAGYDAHIFVQGSFALGTSIRPVNDGDEYDLDFSCKLRQGVTRNSHTQKQLKDLVGRELLAYKYARQIESPLEPKNRCWRLQYKDDLVFHMDVVPGIRADEDRRQYLQEQMTARGLPEQLAQSIARRALWITDQQLPNFHSLSSDWPSSNPGGYQQWFLSRMRPLEKRVLAEAQVDPLPVYRSKTPLQQAVQLLKRHRDVMFAQDSDLKPASIILTTIAGQNYVHGESLSNTVRRVLQAFEAMRLSNSDEVLNPVNPLENFADRWCRPDCIRLQLKRHFYNWIVEVQRHFAELLAGTQASRLVEIAIDGFGVTASEGMLRPFVDAAIAFPPSTPRRVTLESAPARPWRE